MLRMRRRQVVYAAMPVLLVSSLPAAVPVPAHAPPATAFVPSAVTSRTSDAMPGAPAAAPTSHLFTQLAASSGNGASAAAAPAASPPMKLGSHPVMVKKPGSDTSGGFKHMLAGALAGMASKTIMQPLDLVKVRLQVQDGKGKNEYKGLRDGIVSILRTDGFLGLYRGLTPNLMASGVSWGVYFFSYNHAKNFWRAHLLEDPVKPLAGQPPSPPPRLGPFAHLSCAAFSGTLATLFTNPFSMVKTRLQLQGKEVSQNTRVYRGVFDAFTRIVREEGFGTLYRGIGPSLVLVSNGALQFMSYEELKRLAVTHLIASHEERELQPYHFLAMGALAKVFSATATYPMAVTRARLYQRKPDELLLSKIMAEPVVPTVLSTTGMPFATALAPGELGPAQAAAAAAASKQVDRKYDGMIDVISKIWRGEGWKGFYRGLTPMLIKTAPSSALTFLTYETAIKLLNAEPLPKKKAKFD